VVSEVSGLVSVDKVRLVEEGGRLLFSLRCRYSWVWLNRYESRVRIIWIWG
jgi:hypothetical protein